MKALIVSGKKLRPFVKGLTRKAPYIWLILTILYLVFGRHSTSQYFKPTSALMGFMIGSCITEVLIFSLISLFLPLAAPLVYLLGLGIIWTGSLIFSSHYGSFPGVFGISYLMDQPADSLNLATETVNSTDLFAIAAIWLWCALGLLALRIWKKRFTQFQLKWVPRIGLLSLICLFFITKQGLRIDSQCLTPSVHLGQSFVNLSFRLLGMERPQNELKRLNYRMISKALPKLDREAPFHLIWLVHESLRSQSLRQFGAHEVLMPLLEKRMRSMAPERLKLFPKAYSNSTFTHLSIPSLLNGHYPWQKKSLGQPEYLVYEYFKSFLNTKAYIISAHSYVVGNYSNYFHSEALDGLFYTETEGWPVFNNVGADDSHLAPRLRTLLASTDAKENKLFLMIHFNGTHFPYRIPGKNPKYGNKLKNYQNSISYLDMNLDSVFRELEQAGLLDNSLIIMTSDHGESFRENGSSGHLGPLHPTTARIPFMFILPPELAQKKGPQFDKVKENVVSNIDLLPTTLDLLGLDLPEHLAGESLARGIKKTKTATSINLGSGQREIYGAWISEQLFESWYLDPATQKFYRLEINPDGPFKRLKKKIGLFDDSVPEPEIDPRFCAILPEFCNFDAQ